MTSRSAGGGVGEGASADPAEAGGAGGPGGKGFGVGPQGRARVATGAEAERLSNLVVNLPRLKLSDEEILHIHARLDELEKR